MEKFIEKANVLIEALPYIREFFGKTVVIKYGGSAMLDERLRLATAEDIVLMKYVGMNPIVIHGGGPSINEMLKKLGITPKFTSQGLRVTDEQTMAVVEMVLAGTINKDIVALINKCGGKAVGICGKDGHLLYAEREVSEEGADIGRVGKITKVDIKLLQVLCENGFIPVVAPIATDKSGGIWNINADTAAGEIASALKAEKLVFLTDTPGLLRDPSDPDTLIHQLASSEVQILKDSKVISGGMIPKVDACLKALQEGVKRTHIIDGRISHSLLLEIFTREGLGTLVYLS
ncbi:MAG: acetylglutamate kinase [Candidatus Hydrogenedentes bacterium]|nr:acetylglutamate kinase [Candidatus Hydrogenedentota bacterium]